MPLDRPRIPTPVERMGIHIWMPPGPHIVPGQRYVEAVSCPDPLTQAFAGKNKPRIVLGSLRRVRWRIHTSAKIQNHKHHEIEFSIIHQSKSLIDSALRCEAELMSSWVTTKLRLATANMPIFLKPHIVHPH